MAVTFGLDISNWQPSGLDLVGARREGVEFMILKATEGSGYTDPQFGSNLGKARAAGQLAAAYVFVRSNASPQAHLDRARSVVPLDVPVILDVETAADGSQPSLAHTRAVLSAFQAAGYSTPLIYIPRWYWSGAWGSPSLVGLPQLWSSHYPDNTVGSLADEWAQIPASYWDGYGGLGVAVLQFTSSARVAGYQPLDANAFRGTRDQLAALFNQGTDMDAAQDLKLSQIHEQLTALWPTFVAGSNAKLTLVDYARAVDERTVKQTAQLAAIPTTHPSVTLSPADLDALAAKVLAALNLGQLADVVADKLSARLAQ